MKLTPDAESIYRVQDYRRARRIEGVASLELRRFNDAGGAMTELLRLASPLPKELEGFRPAQINYSVLQPDAIKGFHVHLEQTDVWFVPPEDRVLLALVDVRDGSATAGVEQRLMLGDGRSILVRIPPGVAHGCRNLGSGPARIIYLTDRLFSAEPGECDEGRLDWDFRGEAIWEVPRD